MTSNQRQAHSDTGKWMSATGEIEAAHAELAVTIAAIPDVALDWQPGGDEWSLKQVIGHLAHANAFYITIVEQARAAGFGTVRLRRGSAGWRRMLATDSAVAACTTTAGALDCFEQAYQQALALLRTLSPDELDRSFVFRSWQPGAEPVTTTLRQRVIQAMADHLREHQAQLAAVSAR